MPEEELIYCIICLVTDSPTQNRLSPSASKCEVATGLNSEVAFILVSTALIAVLELCKLVITPKLYIRSWLNFGTWIFVGLVLTTTLPNLNKQTAIGPYQYQAAAVR